MNRFAFILASLFAAQASAQTCDRYDREYVASLGMSGGTLTGALCWLDSGSGQSVCIATSGAGIMDIYGSGGTDDERLLWDYETVANEVGVSTTTGVTELDFASIGLEATYFESETANPSSAGALRLANTECIGARNAGNTDDELLCVDASDDLTWSDSFVATGTVTGGTITDGTFTCTAGTCTGGVSITSTTLTDGAGATLTGGTVTGGTLTDGTLSSTAGAVTGVASLSAVDDADVCYGAAPDYCTRYDSTATQFEIWSTDTDGAGADGNLLVFPDGTDYVQVGTGGAWKAGTSDDMVCLQEVDTAADQVCFQTIGDVLYLRQGDGTIKTAINLSSVDASGTLTSHDGTGAGAGGRIDMYDPTNPGVATQENGLIRYRGYSDAGTFDSYVEVVGTVADPSDADEDGQFLIKVMNDGSLTTIVDIDATDGTEKVSFAWPIDVTGAVDASGTITGGTVTDGTLTCTAGTCTGGVAITSAALTSSSALTASGSVTLGAPVNPGDANYTTLASSQWIAYATACTVDRTVTLDDDHCVNGRYITVSDAGCLAGAANNLVVDGETTSTINGVATFSLTTNYESIDVYCLDGSGGAGAKKWVIR
jgi:hypothetical protein